jgi:hypothetical protein
MQNLSARSNTKLRARVRLHILGAAALLGLLLVVPAHTARTLCVAMPLDGGFEAQRSSFVSGPWAPEGRAGIDVRRGFSFRGANNAWARNTVGWNGIRQTVRLAEGKSYTLRAFVRTSGNVRDGYFGFRHWSQRPVKELKFGPLPAYRELRVHFRPAYTGTYRIFAGFWAPNQDSWIQVDEVRIDSSCGDTALNPVDE